MLLMRQRCWLRPRLHLRLPLLRLLLPAMCQ
jgi:hypothetical protein